jgi:DNA-binding transcriptional LysR family regulator
MTPADVHADAISLGDVHIGPVLSPGCYYRCTDTELSVQTVIRRRGSEAAWERWSELSGIRIHHEREITYDLSSLAFEAAERGMGVALAAKFLIEQELKRETLVAPLGFLVFREGLYVHPSAEKPKLSPQTRIFFDWLSANARLGEDGFMVSDIAPMPPLSAGLSW